MRKVQFKSFDELPVMLSVPEVAAVLGISRAGAYVQVLAAQFQEQNGSLICRELLGLDRQTDGQSQNHGTESIPSDMVGGMGNHQPQARTATYYATRPCKELVGSAAEILELWLKMREEHKEVE